MTYFVMLKFENSNSIMVCADHFVMRYRDFEFFNNGEIVCFIDSRDIKYIYHFDDFGTTIYDFENVPFPEVI